MDDPQLPGMLAPFGRFNIHAEYWRNKGWEVTLRHMHAGEGLNCIHVVTIARLTYDELCQAIEDFTAAGTDRFDWLAEDNRCSPHGRD